MRKIIIAALAALTLAGCAQLQTLEGKLGDAYRVLTTTVDNPLGERDIYRVENAYAAALELAVEYRRYCWSKPYAVLMVDPVARPICEKRRAVVRVFQKARRNAGAAIIAAKNFIRDNPTINAAGMVGAAWQAVTDFQKAIPTSR